MDAHNQASRLRTAEHVHVVRVQDTTEINLTKPNCQVEGAGPWESDDKRGVHPHPLYAVTEAGLPLGLVDQVIWTRDKIEPRKTNSQKTSLRKKAAFEEKESCRWLDMFQSGELPGNRHLVIRGCQNRAVLECGDAANVDEALAAAEVRFTNKTNISERAPRSAAGNENATRAPRAPSPSGAASAEWKPMPTPFRPSKRQI